MIGVEIWKWNEIERIPLYEYYNTENRLCFQYHIQNSTTAEVGYYKYLVYAGVYRNLGFLKQKLGNGPPDVKPPEHRVLVRPNLEYVSVV